MNLESSTTNDTGCIAMLNEDGIQYVLEREYEIMLKASAIEEIMEQPYFRGKDE